MYSSSDLECQRIVAGVALRGIENLTCTHACASVSTTLGRLHLTMAATGCAKMYGTPHVGPTRLMSQPLRLTPVPTPVNTITDTTCDNASLRRTKYLGTCLLGKRSHGS